LKPGNVLLARVEDSQHQRHPTAIYIHREGMKPGWFEPKITDFGLAKRLEDGGQMTIAGKVFGSPSYMPPEQASGNWGEVGVLADVYSIGAILYCLLTGKPPFLSSNVVVTLMQVCEVNPAPPNLINPQIDTDLNAICLKCLEKSPPDRYASCRELAEDLSRYLEGLQPLAAQAATQARPQNSAYGSPFEKGPGNARTAWAIPGVQVGLVGLLTALLIGVGLETVWMCMISAMTAAFYFAAPWIPRRKRRGKPDPTKRRISHIWGLYLLGSTFTFLAGEIRGIALLDLLPVIVLEYALVYAFAGFVLTESLYPVSLLCFLAALVAAALVIAWIPTSGPVVFGAVFLVGIGFATWKLGWPFKKSRPSFQDT
jgi:serine/threonine-protein kinase